MDHAQDRSKAGAGFPGPNWRFLAACQLVRPLVGKGILTITCRDGAPGARIGGGSGPRFAIEIDTPRTFWDIARDPDPGLGETYMDGRWELTEGDMGAFIAHLARNRMRLMQGPLGWVLQAFLAEHVPDVAHDPETSRSQVQHHYDLGNDLYEAFLDEGLNYSCAFFDRAEMSLREAQLAKIRTTIARLSVERGQSVLDIGCGWGETCRLLAQEAGAGAVTGVTLAENQHALAVERARGHDLPLQYLLEDYREHAARNPGAYDRIVSIGMFEHVGHENRRQYFAAIRELLKPGAQALVHSIIRPEARSAKKLSSPWLDRYIFPGGCIPDLSSMIADARAEGLALGHEPFVHGPFHYAETLRRWRANFLAGFDSLNHARYDARFKRMWVYYLAMCEAMFAGCDYRVGQILLKRA